MKKIFDPLLQGFEAKGYPISEHYDGDYFTEDILALCEYKTPYIKFGPIKDTKEKNVGKFIIDGLAIASKDETRSDAEELLNSNGPKAAIRQFLGILLSFNDKSTNACPVKLEGLHLRWYFESEIVTMDNGNLEFKVFINCPSADVTNEQRFNPYFYYEDLWKIAGIIYEALNELHENVRFMKMY